ncbi:hypothetical protein D8B26_008416 [Coccidioides posadasii str. Silveira]|uniref:Chromatin modification-related protein n=1 Tax=Coccidioides posadasii (strain RMSCC 757 / Silveira) TaxID=443226 RepID=E9D0B9_COCPS|nr:conserved hypothetical protein [Coccidioides posadasii str. Silveira]QVM08551.1 hypothetical protein D8B26_008416 [Coccidioides posadasii str. Silveira]
MSGGLGPPHGPGELFLEGPSDPDAQATVTDFIDYTEYLPSDLVRSLTLVRDLDKKYLDAANAVHKLTKTYGQLPHLPQETRPEPHALRIQISEQLKRAINAREASFAEASRLYDVVDRHFNRLASIKSKLVALSITTARELAIDLPETKDGAAGAKVEKTEPPTRITLRLDSARQKSRAAQRGARGGRATAFDPSQVAPSVEGSDADAAIGLGVEEGQKKGAKQKKGRRNPRTLQGAEGEHITAERSTSRALAALSAPPPDAKIGSEFLPWLRLTDWEMACLRKKMKKNNFWQPSEVMIHRELSELGRGWDNYRAAREKAESTGTELIDCDDVMNNYVQGKLTRKSDVHGNMGTTGVEETKLINRGMKMNEAKKLKRETQAREQAAQAAAEAELAAKRLGDIGSTIKTLFSSSADHTLVDNVHTGFSGDSSIANGIVAKPRTKPKTTSKKRKFEETAALDAQEEDVEPLTSEAVSGTTNVKKLRLTKPALISNESSIAETTTAKLSLSLGPSGSAKGTPGPSSAEPERPVTRSGRGPSASSKAQPVSTPPTGLKSTRHRSATAGSTEAGGREALHRKSMTPGKAAATDAGAIAPTVALGTTAASRRSKRPAPGPVTAGQDGGSAVSVGRRKVKPAKKKKDQNPKDAQLPDGYRIDEDGVVEEIDPNEPRYCICGDVSFGTMICCEDNDCDREWFHLECVGLTEVPSRTAKWYCPDCRKKLGKAAADGIVRSGGRR